MTRAALVDMARSIVGHAKAGTMELADAPMAVPVESYTDEARFAAEKERIFRRLPLMLAPACELPEPGSYKAMDVAGVPVLLTRQRDGTAQAFLNSCTHRGNPVASGSGTAGRFVCSYHGWSFRNDGTLLGIAAPADFGEVDKAKLCLKSFPTVERAGLIWAVLDPASALDIDAYLGGYDAMLAHFGFADWHLFATRTLPGPNWKVAYDGYLDFYHLPVLHKDTFGADFYNRANFFAWGPHQRLAAPVSAVKPPDSDELVDLAEIDEADWPMHALLTGVWTIFPHVSIASFDGGGVPGAMISQLFPGDTVGESVTTQYYVMAREPATDAERAGANEQFAFLETVVAGEDYATGKRQHDAMRANLLDQVWFGRNEAGGQLFHQWVNRILEADDAALDTMFAPQLQAAE